jgi:Fe-S-cluster containining protein
MEPWYCDGLAFTCTRCGNCCTGPGYVWVTDAEIESLAQLLNEPKHVIEGIYTRLLPTDRRILRDGPTGDCIFYDREKGCTVYPARPTQCRTWPFWERNVDTPEAWAQTKKRCPGAGHGELISVEEITHRIRQIRL